MSVIATLIYLVLQVLFLPLAALASMWVGYRQLMASRRLRVSATAVEIIHSRITLDWFGIRPDPESVALARALPNASPGGLFLALLPLYIRYRLTGKNWLYPKLPVEGQESMAELITARTLYFDRLLLKYASTAEQFVTLGSGYDARSYGDFASRFGGAQFYEVDQPHTLAHKRAALDAAGIDSAHVRFVEVNFATEKLFDRLVASGFDPGKPTLFLMEGVTLYLPESEVHRTLSEIRTTSPSGSAIVLDLYATRFTDGLGKQMGMRQIMEAINEPVHFGLDFKAGWQETVEGFAEQDGFTTGELYFMGQASKNGPYLCVAELVVPTE